MVPHMDLKMILVILQAPVVLYLEFPGLVLVPVGPYALHPDHVRGCGDMLNFGQIEVVLDFFFKY